MLFIQSLFAGAALVAAVAAEVAITKGPDFGTGVEVGKSYTIEYTPADDTPTTIILRKGDGANLDTVGTLTESATSGSFQWTVDTALPNGKDYALEITQGSETNYWGPFPLSGSTASASSSAASSTESSSATSSASSSASKSDSSSASTTKAPTTIATHASASSTISFSGNHTISSATLSRTVTGSASTTPTGTAATTGASSVPTEGAAAAIGASPMAFIFGAVAAMAYLN